VDESFVSSSLSGIADYLKEGVETPLREALESDESLRGGVEDALVAMQDLYFFLQDVPEARSREDLNELAREAVDEYRDEWDVEEVDLKVPERPTMVEINREALLDVLYLLLHNAGSFGGGKPMDVVVRYQDGDCWLVVRDEGEGFEDEALDRAFEPFYSTSRLGLGLGLYHVKKVVQALDGTVEVRNRRKGGGQVEIVLPEAEAEE
jgi:signal transduction histidine kinase